MCPAPAPVLPRHEATAHAHPVLLPLTLVRSLFHSPSLPPPLLLLPLLRQAITSRASPAYQVLHDSLVALPAYRGAYELSQQVLARGQATWAWQKVVGPLVQPALTAVVESRYGSAAIAQLRPAAPAS